jgi:chitodextrinase
MKFKLLSIVFLAVSSIALAQSKKTIWNTTAKKSDMVPLESRMNLPERNLFTLDLSSMKNALQGAPKRDNALTSSNVIALPNADGKLENFQIFENSSMDPALEAKYPEIKSYMGVGIDDPSARAFFSMSPLGFKSMVISADKSAVFIEPISKDLTTYSVYRKQDKAQSLTPFECKVIDVATPTITSNTARPNADDALLRTFRLAMSCTGEYTTYFGGTKALALAAINNSITRCNGVFEMDFGARLIIIANTDLVIYTNASTDPYSAAASMSNWNSQLQSTLTSVIGEANYDIGHLFGATGGGGNAGCIGCICTNGSKGSGITSPADGIPMGDNFDIDYVAHEIGHQMGANHTFTHSNEGTGVQVEPGSGSTIMGYAGITSLDVQPHSDPYFHAVSIQQVTNNIKAKTCSVNIATGNAVPTANAGLDYTIPKSTPFMLTGVGTDANGDALTYDWEQMDSQTTSAAPSATKTTGVDFRSYNPTTSATRYFPKMSSVLTGATTTAGTELTVEALPSVARSMNFRLTVRDNHVGGPANNSDDMIVTVNATAGPFSVTAPNTAVSYVGGSSQTITWNVAGTTANGVNCANVDILISTNAGTTWSTLLAATPNDGTQAVTIPNTPGTTNRIMVKGTNHIFFDVSNTNFTITAGSTDTVAPTAPTLTASGTTQTTTSLSWSGATDNVAVTSYDVYQNGVFKINVATTTYAVTGLTASTAYTFYVIAKDAAGNASLASNTVSVTTLAPVVDTTAPTAPTLTASGTTSSATNLSWTGATDNVAVTSYDVYQNGVFKINVTTTTYAVTGLTASTAYTFYVIAKDAAGNASLASNTVNVTTTAVTLTYCTASATTTTDERIGKVVFGTINNTSTGTAGYENFTALSTNVVRGTANTITITPFWTSTVWSEGYAVFIDYNQNGLFTDAGETVWTKAASTTTPVSGTFTIPATAALGTTRMRVILKYNAIPAACGSFTYGQVEDYTVNITSAAKDTANTIAFNLYPNPVKGEVLNISNLSGASSYSIYNMMGQEVSKGIIENDAVFVGSLRAGTYLLEVTNENGSTSKRFIKE